MSMVEMKNFHKKFGPKIIFDDFSLQVDEGDMVAITGPSGCGKTTLLNTIGLIESVEQGTYQIFNESAPKINSKKANKLIRENISYLFQNFALVDSFTVRDNLLMALKYVKLSKSEKEQLIHDTLQQVNLEGYQDLKVFEISGGEQQRVAVARSILKPSKLILADEPTGSLDPENRDEILAILNQLNKNGKTIIMVTHDNKVAESCHRIIRLGI
ncbi:bacteriocin ABC transporter ATP-binding protein [Enterococcus faecalis]|nr:ABC transporter ATP-binding protein [Enterococcus faecalis]KII42441.1 bacteriocin ABC transporter ATP-binding protein [Enterococcus faecalis]